MTGTPRNSQYSYILKSKMMSDHIVHYPNQNAFENERKEESVGNYTRTVPSTFYSHIIIYFQSPFLCF